MKVSVNFLYEDALCRMAEINRFAARIEEITSGLQADSVNLTETNKARILDACAHIKYYAKED